MKLDPTVLVSVGGLTVAAGSLVWNMVRGKQTDRKSDKEKERDLATQLGGVGLNLIDKANERADRAERSVAEIMSRVQQDMDRICRREKEQLRQELAQLRKDMEKDLETLQEDRDHWRKMVQDHFKERT